MNIGKEIWPNKGYYVTKDGRVFSTRYRKGHAIVELKQSISNSGYRVVFIHHKGYYVHRLVAMAYIPNPNDLPQVNHKNLDKNNNDVTNLEWVTASENVLHAKYSPHKENKTSVKSGTLYHGVEAIIYCKSLTEAKNYCKTFYNRSLCTYGKLNINFEEKLVYVRDDNPIDDLNVFWENQKLRIENSLTKQKLLNKQRRGTCGKLYCGTEFISSFQSLRDAISYLGHDLKRKNDNTYRYKEYVYIKQ